MRKILTLVNRENLVIPNAILYGASIGAISTVMFQRMYMMLTFFTVWLLYVNLKIYYNSFNIDKKAKRELIIVTILGFLTQYNFCFYALFLAITMICLAMRRKEKAFVKSYIWQYIKAAIIGIILFAPSIYHIFFSYRGAGRTARNFTMLEALIAFCENIFTAYSLPLVVGIVLSIIIIALFIWRFLKGNSRGIYTILVVPTILTFLMMVAMSPYKSLRYVMFLLPIVSLGVIILLDEVINHQKVSFALLTICTVALSCYGLVTQPIHYMYIGYQKYIDIAEEYKDDRFVLVMPTVFSQIQDIPEMKIYKETLMIAPEKIEELREYQEFETEEEFILGIKNWIEMPTEEVLQEVLENTGFDKYQLLHTSEKSARLDVYRIYK